jgi:hypothetical protein
MDLIEFFNRVIDKYEDTYITKNKERKFLKNNWSLIKEILEKQEVYGLEKNGLKAIMIIVKEKGYRPYLKILAESSKYYYDLMIYLKFNFIDKELFAKLKINNPLVEILKKKGFINIGLRGKEVLLQKKAIKILYKLTPKDDYLPKEENRLY